MNDEFLSRIVVLGVNIAIVILIIEALILGIFRWRTGRGLSHSSVVLICLSGLGLLIALKAAFIDAGVIWIAIGMMVGGIAHAVDLFQRIRKRD